MFFPWTRTDRLSGLSRRPPQLGHGCSTMNSSSCSRMLSEAVSRYRFSTCFKTPVHPDSYDPCQRSLWYWYVSVFPGTPCRIALRAAAGMSFHGASRSNLNALPSVGSTTLRRYPAGSPHGRITPSRIERLGSPITSSALTSRLVPSPEQSGQAPNGELKENWRGSSSVSESPHLGQAQRSEKSTGFGLPFPWRTTSTTPSAALRAVSIESASRERSAARTASRSTTTAISWF